MWWPHEFLICGDLVSSGCHSRDEEAVWALVVIARNSLELSGVKSISTRSLISTRGWGGEHYLYPVGNMQISLHA